jgi:hypothetical protein
VSVNDGARSSYAAGSDRSVVHFSEDIGTRANDRLASAS